jgi:hypothetical protein
VFAIVVAGATRLCFLYTSSSLTSFANVSGSECKFYGSVLKQRTDLLWVSLGYFIPARYRPGNALPPRGGRGGF